MMVKASIALIGCFIAGTMGKFGDGNGGRIPEDWMVALQQFDTTNVQKLAAEPHKTIK
jgi:hypothetical protein